MPKFIIRWNAGYGDDYDVVECKDLEEAEDTAYVAWNDAVQNQADYEAMEWTQELEDEYY